LLNFVVRVQVPNLGATMEKLNFNLQLCRQLPYLTQFASRMTPDYDDAKDLVQDTLLKAIRYERHYRHGSNIRAWLYVIMKNTFLNNYKALMRKTALIVSKRRMLANPGQRTTARNQCEDKFLFEDIHKIMEKMPTMYTQPFLRYFEGFKYHEIAKEMGIPIGTVKTRIHFARNFLKAKLKMYRFDH